jgi:Protein of unknown function (DUF2911)
MKKIIVCISLCLLAIQAAAQIKIPALSPAAMVQQQVGLCDVTIRYGRPSLKGRKLLGQAAIPFGNVWRMGANEATTFETTDSIMVQGTVLPKGKYAMLAIPGAKEWTIIINSDANQWGAYSYSQKKDILRFTAKTDELKQKEETLSFDFEDITPTSAAVVFRWENSQVKFSLIHNADEKIMAEIKEKTSGEKVNNMTLMESAEYYLLMNRNLNQAMDWVNQLLAKRKSPFTYNLKAQIAQKQGKCDIAIEAAKGAIEYAAKNGDVAAKTAAEEMIKNCEGKK